jgi:hypothetical protein
MTDTTNDSGPGRRQDRIVIRAQVDPDAAVGDPGGRRRLVLGRPATITGQPAARLTWTPP